jgi:GMP synthase (glutamine-hydrolysing)
MKILIVDNGTKHLRKLRELLFTHEITTRQLFGQYDDYDKFSLIILSGGSQISIISAPEIFKEEINLVKTSRVPIIGICEGCEIIAYAFGSKFVYFDKKAKGLKRIDVLDKDSIFGGLDNFKAYEAHHFAITKLGKNLVGLAKSHLGYEVVKHKNKKIYGLQFHPEMLDNESYGDNVFRRIVSKITF